MFYLVSAGIFALCALVLLFLGRIEAASLTIFATFGFLCFRGPFKGLEGATFRELFSDDATHKLDPLLLAGFLGFFVALYLAVKLQVAAAGAVFTASLSALGVAKGSASGVAKAQINHTASGATINPTPTIPSPEAPKMGG